MSGCRPTLKAQQEEYSLFPGTCNAERRSLASIPYGNLVCNYQYKRPDMDG